MKTIIKPAASPSPVGPYNHAVRVGDMLYCSGQIPLDSSGNLITGDVRAQTEQVLRNVKAILDDQKLTFANVVKTTVYLADMQDFQAMNEVYGRHFPEAPPARTTIAAAGLPRGARVEIDVVAAGRDH